MPKYLLQVSYNPEGLKGLMKDHASGRKAIVSKIVESAGGRIESFYYAFGEDDAVVILEMPDNASMAALSLAVSASGLVKTKTTALLTIEETDQALGKRVDYQPPGR